MSWRADASSALSCSTSHSARTLAGALTGILACAVGSSSTHETLKEGMSYGRLGVVGAGVVLGCLTVSFGARLAQIANRLRPSDHFFGDLCLRRDEHDFVVVHEIELERAQEIVQDRFQAAAFQLEPYRLF